MGEIDEFEDDTDDENQMYDAEVVEEPKGKNRTSMSKPTLDSRAQLGADLLLLQGSEWGHVVSLVKKKCPAAIEKSPMLPGHVEIILDELDKSLLQELTQYIAEKSASRKRGPDEVLIEDISGKRSKKKRW